MSRTTEQAPKADSRPCGHLKGKEVSGITLESGGLKVELTSVGASIMTLYAADRHGVRKNVVAGFEEPLAYLDNPHYLGCVLGRYANRIAGGTFLLDGRRMNVSLNDGVNHLHGGFSGLSKKIWELTALFANEREAVAAFACLSPDGEEGYPGNLKISVVYRLDKSGRLAIEYEAETDKATPVSLSNHAYFNLSGFGTPVIRDHLLQIMATGYTEKTLANTPSGRILPVGGTALDFSAPKAIGTDLDKFPLDGGYDHNFVLDHPSPGTVSLAARLTDPLSGRFLNVYTDRPGLQVYTANYWNGQILGQHGGYQRHGAVALETQAFPDSPNHPHFPDTILRPGRSYRSTTVYELGADQVRTFHKNL